MTPERRRTLLAIWAVASATALFGVLPSSLLWAKGDVPVLVVAFALCALALANLVRLWRTEVRVEADGGVAAGPEGKRASSPARALHS